MHNSLITLCILFIHSTNQAYCIEKQPNDNYINSFLNKLITSEKFDELVDIIAEKAARKIQGLDKKGVSQTKHANRIFTQKASDDDTASDEKEESNPSSTTLKNNKLFHVNPKAFIELDASHPQEELSLNYKHLIKKSQHKTEYDGREAIKTSEDYKKKQLNNEDKDGVYRNNINKVTVKNIDLKALEGETVKKSHSEESSQNINPDSREERDKISKIERPSNYGQDEEQSSNEKYNNKNSEETPHRNQEKTRKRRNENDKQSLQFSNEINDNKNKEIDETYSQEIIKPFQGNNKLSIIELNEKQKKINNHHQVTIKDPYVTKTISTNQIRQEAGNQILYEPLPEYQEYFKEIATSKSPNLEIFLT